MARLDALECAARQRRSSHRSWIQPGAQTTVFRKLQFEEPPVAQRRVYASQAHKAFLEGHVAAFEATGRVPVRQIRNDSLSPAVARVLADPEPHRDPEDRQACPLCARSDGKGEWFTVTRGLRKWP